MLGSGAASPGESGRGTCFGGQAWGGGKGALHIPAPRPATGPLPRGDPGQDAPIQTVGTGARRESARGQSHHPQGLGLQATCRLLVALEGRVAVDLPGAPGPGLHGPRGERLAQGRPGGVLLQGPAQHLVAARRLATEALLQQAPQGAVLNDGLLQGRGAGSGAQAGKAAGQHRLEHQTSSA